MYKFISREARDLVPRHEISNKVVCATSKASDHPQSDLDFSPDLSMFENTVDPDQLASDEAI